MNKTVIKFENLSVKRTVKILDNINWQVVAGESWVILGANGSGKSSLINILTAYMAPTSGDIYLFGKKYGAYNWSELRPKVGIVSNAIHQLINNSETVLNAIVSGKYAMINYYPDISDEDQQKALKILEKVKCSELVNQRWDTLSQGEKQRVLIGRAMMSDSNLLILDEPCIGLDPVARERFLAFVKNIIKTDLPVILITHHVEEITEDFTNVLLLKDGKILATGPKHEVMSSENLSQLFDCNLTLSANLNRYSLKVTL